MVRVAVIGGSGVYDFPAENKRSVTVETPYGKVEVTIGLVNGEEVAFLARHGKGHSIPPHKINYRANIWALYELGVERIIATSAVGSMNPNMRPGDFVILDQIIDFTVSRPRTFYDGEESPHDRKFVAHVDFTEPYCPEIRRALIAAAKELSLPYHPRGTYVCTEGPRFETAAEIKAYRILGGDVVGMTQCPEAILARELEICYATVAIVTNYAAGISGKKLTHSEVVELMNKKSKEIVALITKAIPLIPKERNCPCKDALKGATG
ncbi:S-methyl-5'-thioadenosine phosphorylase [Pyrococcus abyssi]|uniref:Probable 6-oxopurine nucleoside phosphorylase n=1 Tax=Pyrococcus abyssi (strain GE5 / Orsay) TaxID=272844 RepID=Q9UZS1_PYRAB|nr:S-methyl-5'-thioadenosine phosphorylase [Pyrococcus abyssi]CAB49985.1 Phosphorylase, PNP/MTAP family [Pyrococcus abyssi GE5]CCE70485.1 TPA: 5'-methylthioadenosine phosphorylase [Pyrococcus abyssi GE5]